jgi:hypothetical protein
MMVDGVERWEHFATVPGRFLKQSADLSQGDSIVPFLLTQNGRAISV